MASRKIEAADFKKGCLTILDELDLEGVIVTKHGKPIAQITPLFKTSAQLIGSLKEHIVVHGNLFSTGEPWHAET